MGNKKILGIDLGTNSIGWAVLEKTGENNYRLFNKNNFTQAGVIVFPEVTSSGKTKAAERREFRGARKLKYRRKLRKYETLRVLIKENMCPLEMQDLENWKGQRNEFKQYPTSKEFLNWLNLKETKTDNTQNVYYFRDYVSRNKLDLNKQRDRYMLGRALYHMAQRRGFKSNRLDQTDLNIVQTLKDELLEVFESEKDNLQSSDDIQKLITEFFLDKGYDISGKKSEMDDDTGKDVWAKANYLLKIALNKKREYNNLQKIKDAIIHKLQKTEELGKVKTQINNLSDAIKKDKNSETLGQYFWNLYQKNRHDATNKIRGKYTSREEHYLHEFDHIMRKQFPEMVDERYGYKQQAHQRYNGIALDLYKAIFFQRPLKSQKGKVALCLLEPGKRRMQKNHYLFEEFRMWQFINHIKIKEQGSKASRFLTVEEKQTIIPLFYRVKEKFYFDDIAKKLIGKQEYKYYKDSDTDNFITFNYKKDFKVTGNPISARLKKALGDKWNQIYKIQNHKKERKQIPVTYNELAWQALLTFEYDYKLRDFAINKLGLNEKNANYFITINLPQGYANLSYKALNNILPWLRKGFIYSHAVFIAKLPEILKPEIWENYKDDIISGISYIVDNHKYINNTINNFIDRNRKKKPENRVQFSEQAEDMIKRELLNGLINEYGEDLWEAKSESEKEKIIDFVFETVKNQLAKNSFKGGTFYKITPLEDKIKSFLKGENENGLIYCEDEEKLGKLYHPSKLDNYQPIVKDGNLLLPVFKTQSVKNPTLNRAMSQLRKLVNYLLENKIIDKHTRINIEMAREVNSINRREAIQQWQEKQQQKRENAKNRLLEYFNEKCKNGPGCKEAKQITDDMILRYLLWEEQREKSIYEGENIGICDTICKGSIYDIDHIVPVTRSWDNSMANKTLARDEFNRKTKGNKLPAELENFNEIKRIAAEIYKKKYEALEKEIKKRISPTLGDKKRKKLIIQREVNRLDWEYYKSKYENFTRKTIPDGFKNRQLVETGLISRVAYEYLSCLFKNENGNSNVSTVTGRATSEFRKAWGIPDKTRDSHTHHMVDAIIIAAIDKKNYEKLAKAWEQDKKINKTKILPPWDNFVADILKLEKEKMVVHINIDNIGKHTVKIKRRRGKPVKKRVQILPEEYRNKVEGKDYKKVIVKGKVYYDLPEKVYLQGDTARDGLHKQNFYGVIKQKVGDTYVEKYVIRKEITKLKKGDIDNIVDKDIRNIIKAAVKNKIITFNKQGAKIKKDEKIWRNKDEKIEIKKVRIEFNEQMIKIKQHQPAFLSKYEYKQNYYAQNANNYLMVLYESEDKEKREVEFVNLFDYYESFNDKEDKYPKNIIKGNVIYHLMHQNNKPLILKKDLLVFIRKKDEEIQLNDEEWKYSRLYKIIGLDGDAIKLMHHTYAKGSSKALQKINQFLNDRKKEEIINELSNLGMENESIKEIIESYTKEPLEKWFKKINQILNNYYLNKGINKTAKYRKSSITSGKGGDDIFDNYEVFPYIKIKPNGFNALIENIDFIITENGKIIELT